MFGLLKISVEKSVKYLNDTTLDTQVFSQTSVQMCTHMHYIVWGKRRAFLGYIRRDHGLFQWPAPPVLTRVKSLGT